MISPAGVAAGVPASVQAAGVPAGVHAAGLRVAVLVASLAGLLTLVAADLVRMPVGICAGALLTGASGLSAWATSGAAYRWRHLTSGVLIVGAGLLVLASVGSGWFQEPGPALALVLVTVMVIHALGLEAVRDLFVALAVTLGSVLLAVGMGAGPAITGPLLVTWVAVVTALTLAHRERQGQGCWW